MDTEEKSKWDARYREHPESWTQPDDFLMLAHERYLKAQTPGLALDLAGGAGRNSIYMVDHGWRVDLLDISDVALQLAREKLGDEAGRLNAQSADLNSVSTLGEAKYNLILVFYFLRRELFPAIVRALRPGGFLIYRTYTIDRMKVPGGPTDPMYLLQKGELREAFRSLDILFYNETKSGKAVAELVARRA